MGDTLIIGDSHSQGYWREPCGGDIMNMNPLIEVPHVWSPNNYAEKYANLNNKRTIIYSMAGATITRYPDWMKFCLDMYPDIDEVFVQALHWNRFHLSGNENRNYEDEIPLDYFTIMHSEEEFIHRWSDYNTVPEEEGLRDHDYFPTKVAPEDYDSLQYIPPHWKPDMHNAPYIVVKLWGELMTHIQHREYCKNLFVLDRMCHEHGVKMHFWRIDDRVHLPNANDIYGDLKATTIVRKSAKTYLQEIGYDIGEMMMPDREHHTEEAHQLIAEHFMPYCKSLASDN